MKRGLLSELLPLRSSAVLGTFDKNETLQLIYGDLTASATKLVKLTDKRYLFSDGAAEVTSVLIDRQATDAYEYTVETFDGKPATIIELGADPPEGATVYAMGYGRLSAKTGQLIESPADILEDLLKVANYEFTPGLDDLRVQAGDLKLGRVVNGGKTLRYWLDNLMQSIGGYWTPRITGLYPPPVWDGALNVSPTLNPQVIELQEAVIDSADYRSSLLIGFAYSSALERFDQSITLKAKISPFDVEPEVNNEPYDCGWLRLPKDALSVGSRLLARYATDRVRVRFTTNHADIYSGALVYPFSHPRVPTVGERPVFILNATYNLMSGLREVEAEVLLQDPVVDVELTSRSIGFVKASAAAIEVVYKNGVATFTIVEDNNAPVVDAFVSLSGSVAKKTDFAGKVSFEAAPGLHVVAVEKLDFEPFEIEITL